MKKRMLDTIKEQGFPTKCTTAMKTLRNFSLGGVTENEIDILTSSITKDQLKKINSSCRTEIDLITAMPHDKFYAEVFLRLKKKGKR